MSHFDLAVIGGGPGGYIAAIRAAQLGMNVACIEREPQLGGTCLRVGCIPSKALLESSAIYDDLNRAAFTARGIKTNGVELDPPTMHANKAQTVDTLATGIEGLFKKNKITRLSGTASLGERQENGSWKILLEGKTSDSVTAQHVILATGSVPSSLPGIEPDGSRVVTSTEAIAFDKVPKHLVVVGGGYIGLELGTVWRRLGAQVTVLEYLDRILPGTDAEIANEARKIFQKQGITFQLGARVEGVDTSSKGCTVKIADAKPIQCDRVLLAVGRRPQTAGLGLEKVGVECDRRGFVQVDRQYRTTADGVYAVGDVIGGAMLAHKAEEEGVACVEGISGRVGHVNYDAIPSVCYTHPEIAAVGRTEEQLKDEGVAYRKGLFPFAANSRARAVGHTEGKVKILADEKTDRILGVHIIGPQAGELIAEATAAIEFGATSEDLAMVCHPHPTLSEAVREAALAVDNRTLNL